MHGAIRGVFSHHVRFLAGNVRTAADRSIALGWKPSRPIVLEGLEGEIRVAVKTD